jgi:hypothetical protein
MEAKPTASAKVLQDFMQLRSPKLNEPRPIPPIAGETTPALPPSTGSETPMDDIQLEKKLQEAMDAATVAPAKTYDEKLKDLGITREEANSIIDAIMTNNVYERAYPITKNSRVVFRTRELSDQESTQDIIERSAPQFMGTMGLIMSKNNLLSSLAELNGTRFEDNDVDRSKAKKFIERLPYAVFSILINKLVQFDTLIATVTDESALQNF